ncbi:MAG: hypothetical protein ACOX88_01565 [Christensenellales bacterium]
MRSILEEFAYGNISPEAQFFKRGSATKDYHHTIDLSSLQQYGIYVGTRSEVMV